MSCYEWERGSYIIPSSQWAVVKKHIRDRYNEVVNKDFSLANQLVETAKLAGKGKRNVDWKRLLSDVYYNSFANRGYAFKAIDPETIVSKLVSQETGKPVTPKKMDFPWANGATKSFSNVDATLTINDESREIIWSVPENNRACSDARESALGQIAFATLGKVTWTRGSGGYLTGNDEYNRDSTDEGRGGNYIKDAMGPLGEQAQERESGFPMRSLRSRRSGPRY